MGLWPSTWWGNFGFGALAAVVGPAVLRPVLVGVVRAGYEVTDYASQSWQQAKAEAESIKTEARTSSSEAAEVEQLRQEVAALRAQVQRRGAPATT